VSFLDTATTHLCMDLEIGRIAVGADSSFARKTNETSRIRQERGVIVLAIERGQGLRFNPESDDRIEAEDLLILMGEPAQLRQIEQMAGFRS
jgi:TrkA domain protein